MKLFKCMFVVLLLVGCTQRHIENRVSLIPYPQKCEVSENDLLIKKDAVINIVADKNISDLFSNQLEKIFKSHRFLKNEAKADHNFYLTIDQSLENLGNEGYKLIVDSNSVSITAFAEPGLFYGIQTLYQLLPGACFNNPAFNSDINIAQVKIEDKPKFEYRGVHLDVARHYFPKDFILKYIDMISKYKMNKFHWHLTEDQGWRIEIKKYPKLQEISSMRKETMGDGKPHGGYYTQEEVKEVVAYAKERFIDVIPEIEMPGHSQAALAAYPEFSCTGGPFEVHTEWGVHADVYCAGKEETFKFLEDILTEVTELFPSKYIHIGGDESPKARWEKCPDCQTRIEKEKLKDEHELQSYFITRMEKFLNSKDKAIIGWDEILEGGLAPNATVMSWRGMKGGIEAANAEHNVIMTPTSHCYFDYYQAKEGEPKAIGGFLPIDTVYSFQPIPAGMEIEKQKYIIGAQANVWTEYMPVSDQVEYMLFPRICALSEVVWTYPEVRDINELKNRLEKHYIIFKANDVKFKKYKQALK